MREAMGYEAYERWKSEAIDGEPALSVVIPTYNEEIRILPTIGAIASHVCDLGVPWEMIVADDGSKDMTVAIVEDLGFKNLRVLPSLRNKGKGAAVKRGMLEAAGAAVMFADADQSTPIEQLGRFLVDLEDGADVVIGSRALAGASETKRSLGRRLLSAGLRRTVRFTLGVDLSDTQCGFKLFTRDAAQRLFNAQTIDGFSFDLEILFLAKRLGMRVVEVPVEWHAAPDSKVDARKEAVRGLGDLVRIRRNERRGAYDDA